MALATSGPGATNLVTPIADAVMDSVPTVFLTGQVRTELLGTDGFQEADYDRHHDADRQALDPDPGPARDPAGDPRGVPHRRAPGGPGPVLVDIPQDLSRADISYEPVDQVSLPGYRPTTEGNVKQIRLAAKALANARRPVIYAGGGVINADAAKELRELCGSDRFPVTCTVMGLGGFPAPHDQWLGMLGMHGTRAANYAMDEADLICAVGARFDDRITGKLSEFAPRAKFIHIDIDPAEISKNVPAHIPIVGDAKRILPKLTREYRALETDSARLDGWWERIRGLAGEAPARLRPTRRTPRSSRSTCARRCTRPPAGRPIVTSDVGQHQMWCAQYYHFSEPRQWINSGGLGTMGFGLPSAHRRAGRSPRRHGRLPRGRRLAADDLTGARHRVTEEIPVKVFIMNNGYLGMVRQWQELFWDKRYSAVEMGASPDWVKLAEAYGATGMRARRRATLVEQMREAIADGRPGGARRPGHQGGELLPDDPGGPGRAGHGGLERDG